MASDDDIKEKARQIVRLIQSGRFDLSSEKRLQADIETLLSARGIVFTREARISAEDIPDFLVDGCIAVECKMRSAKKMDVFRQLSRYAEQPGVKIIVLASNLSMTLPATLNEKPVFMASVSRGWM